MSDSLNRQLIGLVVEAARARASGLAVADLIGAGRAALVGLTWGDEDEDEAILVAGRAIEAALDAYQAEPVSEAARLLRGDR